MINEVHGDVEGLLTPQCLKICFIIQAHTKCECSEW